MLQYLEWTNERKNSARRRLLIFKSRGALTKSIRFSPPVVFFLSLSFFYFCFCFCSRKTWSLSTSRWHNTQHSSQQEFSFIYYCRLVALVQWKLKTHSLHFHEFALLLVEMRARARKWHTHKENNLPTFWHFFALSLIHNFFFFFLCSHPARQFCSIPWHLQVWHNDHDEFLRYFNIVRACACVH